MWWLVSKKSLVVVEVILCGISKKQAWKKAQSCAFYSNLSDVAISIETTSNVGCYAKLHKKRWTSNCCKHSRESIWRQLWGCTTPPKGWYQPPLHRPCMDPHRPVISGRIVPFQIFPSCSVESESVGRMTGFGKVFAAFSVFNLTLCRNVIDSSFFNQKMRHLILYPDIENSDFDSSSSYCGWLQLVKWFSACSCLSVLISSDLLSIMKHEYTSERNLSLIDRTLTPRRWESCFLIQ